MRALARQTSNDYDHRLLQRWIKAGYAVVRTDYQGLGTAGPHPYLIGDAEGHDVLDAVTAARLADRNIANDVAISGHSQGGQAALFAASLAPKYAPSLKVKGTVAFAPVSHLAEQGSVLRSVDTTSLTALAAMILRGTDISNPGLNLQSLLTPQAARAVPADRREVPAGARQARLLRRPADVAAVPRGREHSMPSIAALGKQDDPEDLKISTPVEIEQGTADTTVFPAFSQQTADALKTTYKTYNGLNHGTIVTAAKPQADATAFLKKKLG